MAGSGSETTTCLVWAIGDGVIKAQLSFLVIIFIHRYPNPEKFPLGIAKLAEDVNKAGCRFGLWFEPEMISEDSVLMILIPL